MTAAGSHQPRATTRHVPAHGRNGSDRYSFRYQLEPHLVIFGLHTNGKGVLEVLLRHFGFGKHSVAGRFNRIGLGCLVLLLGLLVRSGGLLLSRRVRLPLFSTASHRASDGTNYGSIPGISGDRADRRTAHSTASGTSGTGTFYLLRFHLLWRRRGIGLSGSLCFSYPFLCVLLKCKWVSASPLLGKLHALVLIRLLLLGSLRRFAEDENVSSLGERLRRLLGLQISSLET